MGSGHEGAIQTGKELNFPIERDYVKDLRGIHGHDAVKAFRKAGGEVRQGKGDHVNIKMPNGQLITIPVSKELKIGLLKAAIKKAGLTEEIFLKFLR